MRALFEAILSRLQEVFDPQVFGEKVADLSVNFVVALVTFGVFYLGWLIIWFFLARVMRSSKLDETSQAFVRTVVKYSIILAGLFNALSVMGIDTAGLLASLGIVGITIGFAARDAFSNLISGILIFLDRPFVIGDLVEVGDFYGRVDQITLRSARIITPDGKMLAVPNTEMINKTVTSYTNFPHLRLDIPVTIGVNEDIEKVRQILLGIVQGNPDYLEEPAAKVMVTQLNDYNIALELRAWIKEERNHVQMRSDLREKVYLALSAAQVDMPFQTLQLSPLKVSLEES